MTQQYLAGEISLSLAQLQSATSNQACQVDATHLHWKTETGPLAAPSSIVVRALELAGLCWDSLHRETHRLWAQGGALCKLLDDRSIHTLRPSRRRVEE